MNEEETQKMEEVSKISGEFDRMAKLLVERDIELSKANDILREVDKVKSEFVSVVAHQLRTPLSAIKWIFNFLLEGNAGEMTEEQKGLLKKGYESNERMISLVNDMLEVTRIEGGALKYDFESAHIEEMLNQSLVDYIGQAYSKHVTIVLDKGDGQFPPVKVDKKKIQMVFQNIIENAIKYTNEGGSVIISFKKGKDVMETAVKDNGIGIPEAEQKNIFTKFYRATNATKSQTEGSGLGLFVARSVIEKHGGKMWFESNENQGTTFHFTLPYATPTF